MRRAAGAARRRLPDRDPRRARPGQAPGAKRWTTLRGAYNLRHADGRAGGDVVHRPTLACESSRGRSPRVHRAAPRPFAPPATQRRATVGSIGVRIAGWLVATVLGVVVLPTRAAADATDVPHGLIRFRSFGSAEGLHNLVIQSITQDADGYLWIATDDGVSRYDGEKFTHFGVDQGLLSTVSRVVGVAPDGNVCVGDPKGLVCWDGARFAVPDPGLPRGAVHAIASGRGRLWIGAASGLYVRDGQGTFVRAPGWPGTTAVKALWTDARGLVVGDEGRVLVSDGDGQWRELSGICLLYTSPSP